MKTTRNKTPTNTFKHMSSIWTCMAAQGLAKSTLQRCVSPSQQQRSQKAKASAAQEDLASSSDDEYLYTMNHGLNVPKIPKASIKISDVVVNMVIETCATTNILDEATYPNIHQIEDTELQLTTKCSFAYGSDSQLTTLDKFDAIITFKDKHKVTTIHVIQGNHGSLLSYKTTMDLSILALHVNHFQIRYQCVSSCIVSIQIFSMALEGSK